MVHVDLGGGSHHGRISASNLHCNRFELALVIGTALGFFTIPQQGIGCDHFRDRITRTQFFAELPKWTISYASHGRNEESIG